MAKGKSKPSDVFDISDMFDTEEKAVKMISLGVKSSVNIKECISSSMLTLDLSIGGGLQRGRVYEIVGPEHGGKTTMLYGCFANAMKKIPNSMKGIFLDIEGLVDPAWFGNIVGERDMDSVFGRKDEDTNKWIEKPQIRYYKPAFGEQGLRFVRRVLKRLPDKVLMGKTWYYMWSPVTPKIAKKTGGYTLAELRSLLKDKFIKKYLTKYGNFYVPIPNNYGGPEMLIGIDSWAAMTPQAVAEDDSNALGGPARMFGKYLNDIKSLVSSKGCTLVGINQVREKPMAWGCVHADTVIPFVDGSSYNMREVVENKIEGEVFSFNQETKKIEPKKIVDWHYNGKIDKKEDWISFKTKAVDTKNGVIGFTITPGHKILIHKNKKYKWIEAKNAKIGDMLVTKFENKINGTIIDFELDNKVLLKNAFVEITDIVIGSNRKFGQKGKYDISIEDNKNYLVGNVDNGIIIHNSPEYSPGGNTLKHMGDCRIRIQGVANQNGKGAIEEEDEDEYRHFKIKIIKNKLYIPFKETTGRWWTSHGGKTGFGVCPVWDCLNYLKMTGQFRGKKKGFNIVMPEKTKVARGLAKKVFTYDTFKEHILNPKKHNLRLMCEKQMSKGIGMKLFQEGDVEEDINDEEV